MTRRTIASFAEEVGVRPGEFLEVWRRMKAWVLTDVDNECEIQGTGVFNHRNLPTKWTVYGDKVVELEADPSFRLRLPKRRQVQVIETTASQAVRLEFLGMEDGGANIDLRLEDGQVVTRHSDDLPHGQPRGTTITPNIGGITRGTSKHRSRTESKVPLAFGKPCYVRESACDTAEAGSGINPARCHSTS